MSALDSTYNTIVEKSVTGKVWLQKHVDMRRVDAIAQKYSLSPIMAKILCLRDVAPAAVLRFLYADIKTCLPDPLILKDMEKFLHVVHDAIKRGQAIGIFGDYDVDGAASSALLAGYLRAVGAIVHIHIPDRRIEGYGPNIKSMQVLVSKGCGLIICVDCGTTAFTVLEKAQESGIAVGIIDHHAVGETLPKCLFIVNPLRVDDTSFLDTLCSAGLVFCSIVALDRFLRHREYIKDTPFKLLSMLDLVAMATVCDVVPLRDLNRAFVRQGLKVMARRLNPGLRALADSCNIDTAIRPYHLGFVLGPRLNAGGRIDDCSLALKLLSTKDFATATTLALQMNMINARRIEMEDKILRQALLEIKEGQGDYGSFILVHSKDWHIGILGIIASRLKERFCKPAIVISFAEGIGRGSGRSIEEIDLGALIRQAYHKGILVTGGGHKMAVGLSIKAEHIATFCTFFRRNIKSSLIKLSAASKTAIVPKIWVDANLSVSGINAALYKELSQLEPFGSGNPEPIFLLKNVVLSRMQIVGDQHVSMYIRSPLQARSGIGAICFRCATTDLGQAILQSSKAVSICVKIHLNTWRGKEKIQLVVLDMAT